jgi:hypothetical protein
VTLLDSGTAVPALTADELAKRWVAIERLPEEEGKAFADDIETSVAALPQPKSAWD